MTDAEKQAAIDAWERKVGIKPAPMTPERLESIRVTIVQHPGTLFALYGAELLSALETEIARLDMLSTMPPGARLDALADPRGLRAALDDRIAEREKGTVR